MYTENHRVRLHAMPSGHEFRALRGRGANQAVLCGRRHCSASAEFEQRMIHSSFCTVPYRTRPHRTAGTPIATQIAKKRLLGACGSAYQYVVANRRTTHINLPYQTSMKRVKFPIQRDRFSAPEMHQGWFATPWNVQTTYAQTYAGATVNCPTDFQSLYGRAAELSKFSDAKQRCHRQEIGIDSP